MTRTFLILVLSALLLACSNGDQQVKTDTTPDSLTIRVAVLPTLDCLPLYYAQQEGIFDSLGIHVRLKTYKAAMDADTAFLGQSADAIMTDLVKAAIWQANGDSICVTMGTPLQLYLLTAYSARIRQTTSLKEKIIGITRHSAVDMATDMILNEANLLSTDLNKPQINNVRLRCLMVDQNQYDGAMLPEPYASECEARGARRVTGTPQLGIRLGAFVMKDSVYKRHKDDADKLRQAYEMAVVQLNERIARFQECLTDTILMNSKDAPRLGLIEYFPAKHRIELPDTLLKVTAFDTPFTPDDSTLAKVQRWCKGRELLKKDIDLSTLLINK